MELGGPSDKAVVVGVVLMVLVASHTDAGEPAEKLREACGLATDGAAATGRLLLLQLLPLLLLLLLLYGMELTDCAAVEVSQIRWGDSEELWRPTDRLRRGEGRSRRACKVCERR